MYVYVYIYKLSIEEDIDGPTLLGLTEGMLKELLPTIKLRVQMTDMIKLLKVENETSTSTQILPTTPNQAECDNILVVEKEVSNAILNGT